MCMKDVACREQAWCPHVLAAGRALDSTPHREGELQGRAAARSGYIVGKRWHPGRSLTEDGDSGPAARRRGLDATPRPPITARPPPDLLPAANVGATNAGQPRTATERPPRAAGAGGHPKAFTGPGWPLAAAPPARAADSVRAPSRANGGTQAASRSRPRRPKKHPSQPSTSSCVCLCVCVSVGVPSQRERRRNGLARQPRRGWPALRVCICTSTHWYCKYYYTHSSALSSAARTMQRGHRASRPTAGADIAMTSTAMARLRA